MAIEGKPKGRAEIRKERDQEAVLRALSESGNVSFSCKRAGVSRETFYRWQKEDEGFRLEAETCVTMGKKYVNDLAHTHLVRKIQDGDSKAITFHLAHCHPDYNPQAYPDRSPPVAAIMLMPVDVKPPRPLPWDEPEQLPL